MSILNAQVNPAMAKNIMYLCMAAPALAFELHHGEERDRVRALARSRLPSDAIVRARAAIRVQPSVALASRLTLSPPRRSQTSPRAPRPPAR